jgi:hypothetical protein
MPAPNVLDWSPRLLEGEGSAPPEDVGGPHGYELFLRALNDPEHPEHDEYRSWVGPHYGATRYDVWAMDHAVALAVAWRAI